MYYTERNKLLKDDIEINLKKLREYFYQIYTYFNKKDCFNAAFFGISINDRWSNEETQVVAPLLSPSPEIFFLNHLHDNQIYPIYEYYEYYTEDILFSVIEILYENISIYDYINSKLIIDIVKKEFSDHINNILKFYKEGFYLDPKNGYIINLPNETLVDILNFDPPSEMPKDAIDEMRAAIKTYYRFNSSSDDKRAAIFMLARILEGFRNDLKEVLNQQFEINKNVHDKLIFDILNNFDVRHNTEKQYSDYNKEIWYDWMMQYYSSVIVTYFKLKNSISQNEELG